MILGITNQGSWLVSCDHDLGLPIHQSFWLVSCDRDLGLPVHQHSCLVSYNHDSGHNISGFLIGQLWPRDQGLAIHQCFWLADWWLRSLLQLHSMRSWWSLMQAWSCSLVCVQEVEWREARRLGPPQSVYYCDYLQRRPTTTTGSGFPEALVSVCWLVRLPPIPDCPATTPLHRGGPAAGVPPHCSPSARAHSEPKFVYALSCSCCAGEQGSPCCVSWGCSSLGSWNCARCWGGRGQCACGGGSGVAAWRGSAAAGEVMGTSDASCEECPK